ncbi:MAG: type II toxin-antitoxin system HicA family toxin [Tannerellaceae bacterium]|jgi:predicted RNA binding protein YcfA (HicA-like mRNA interferase family)|nr:type II toxin-antitoxin system HicA family toxin [Tannerellaceae bacterium]
MKSSELHRKAVQAGWTLLYQDGSSHRYYEKDNRLVCIPFHGSKEMPTGTCKKILKELGLK